MSFLCLPGIGFLAFHLNVSDLPVPLLLLLAANVLVILHDQFRILFGRRRGLAPAPWGWGKRALFVAALLYCIVLGGPISLAILVLLVAVSVSCIAYEQLSRELNYRRARKRLGLPRSLVGHKGYSWRKQALILVTIAYGATLGAYSLVSLALHALRG